MNAQPVSTTLRKQNSIGLSVLAKWLRHWNRCSSCCDQTMDGETHRLARIANATDETVRSKRAKAGVALKPGGTRG